MPVICRTCGDPVDDHVGTHTPNPDCACCSWRKEAGGRWIKGPLGNQVWQEDRR